MKEDKIHQIIDEHSTYKPDYNMIGAKIDTRPRARKLSLKTYLGIGLTSLASIIIVLVLGFTLIWPNMSKNTSMNDSAPESDELQIEDLFIFKNEKGEISYYKGSLDLATPDETAGDRILTSIDLNSTDEINKFLEQAGTNCQTTSIKTANVALIVNGNSLSVDKVKVNGYVFDVNWKDINVITDEGSEVELVEKDGEFYIVQNGEEKISSLVIEGDE